MSILERGSGDGWQLAESTWISKLRALGANLTNHTAGGEGLAGRPHSEETRAKISANGIRNRPDVKKRMNEACKAAWGRPEVREAHKAAYPRAALTRSERRQSSVSSA